MADLVKSKRIRLLPQIRAASRKQLILAAVFAGALVVIALLAPKLCLHDPYATSSALIRQAPSAEYWFGTDDLGRCVFSRVLMGARTTIAATFLLVAVTFLFGTFLGMICGWYGRFADACLMRIVDIGLAFPQMVVAIAVAGILGGGLGSALIALGVTMWTGFARLARSHTKSLMKQPFIRAARLSGRSGLYLMAKHVLPNILPSVLTNALTQIGTTMIGISGLSFLGLGVVPPQAEWGSMINSSRAYIQIAPWEVLFPAAATVLTIVAFNILGDCVISYRETRAGKVQM